MNKNRSWYNKNLEYNGQAFADAFVLNCTNFKTHGYKPCQHTPGLWKHEWRPISFVLVADAFGVKYIGKPHFQHLINTVKSFYPKVAVD